MMASNVLSGPRHVLDAKSHAYPKSLAALAHPPDYLYIIGSVDALTPGLAVIGARKATPYGRTCARRFARLAAEMGVNIISGGARGCDSEAHKAALNAQGSTVVFLGGGCDCVYPAEHFGLFQRVIDAGGAVVSEHPWDTPPLRPLFRARNRLIAGLASAVLIVEAGLPSGTFSTADEALDMGKEVLVVPGAITSETSRGSNRLLFQGATPVVDDDSFGDALLRSCGMLKRPGAQAFGVLDNDPILQAVLAQPLDDESLLALARAEFGQDSARSKLMESLAEAEAKGVIARNPDGKWGPVVPV